MIPCRLTYIEPTRGTSPQQDPCRANYALSISDLSPTTLTYNPTGSCRGKADPGTQCRNACGLIDEVFRGAQERRPALDAEVDLTDDLTAENSP